MTDKTFRRCSILVMEDDADDAWLLEHALKKLGVTGAIHIVPDGEQGIAYLTGLGLYSDRKTYPLPGLIITDLKMPLLNGLEVLKWIDAHPEIRKIPTLVLTSSRAESDVANAYGFGANSYMVKPTTFDDLEKLSRVIRDYWDSCEMPARLQLP